MKIWGICILTAVLTHGLAAGETVAGSHGSLYERLGGMPAIRSVVDDFVGRILADQRVNRWFAHAAADPEEAAAYKAKLADFLCQGTGGPCKYTGADMGTPGPRRHRGGLQCSGGGSGGDAQ